MPPEPNSCHSRTVFCSKESKGERSEGKSFPNRSHFGKVAVTGGECIPCLVALPWKTSGQQWGKGMEEDSGVRDE